MKTGLLLLVAFVCIMKCNYDAYGIKAIENEPSVEVEVTPVKYRTKTDSATIWLDETGKPFAVTK